ncbi:MAG: GNAT family N-acetyltransferase [Chitinophagaceae bacterium]
MFSNAQIKISTERDITSLIALINSAYRGVRSTKGWTTEAHLIAGDSRTNEMQMKGVLAEEGSAMLKYQQEETIWGCVNLQLKIDRIYLGMLSVSPEQQAKGIGKILLHAAEEYAHTVNAKALFMTVISVRSELIAWYKRHGYVETGEVKPFIEDEISGKHLQKLSFIVLEKLLT